MRKQRVLLFVSLVLLLIAVFPVSAQDTIVAPDGKYSAPVPAGWTARSESDHVVLTSDNGIAVYLLTVNAAEIAQGIEAGIAAIDPAFDFSPAGSNTIPLPNGTWTQSVYVNPDGRLDVAIGQVADETTYLMYMRFPTQAALQAKQGDVNAILMGFTIGEAVDLVAAQPVELTDAMLADVEQYILDSMEEYQLIGASVGIVQDGQIVYSSGFGSKSMTAVEPVDGQTLFMIGSTTKSMTTLLTASLVDDGVLDWDAPVTDILPDFHLRDDVATAQIRVRDLFNMTSGLPRYDLPIMVEELTPMRVQEVIAEIPMASRPGDAFHYSNLMVALGGFAAAVADGAALEDAESAYEALMQTRVFDPIDMTSTTFSFERVLDGTNYALPYTYDPFTRSDMLVPISFERALRGIAPAGSLWSNADDMARYLITQINQGVTPDGERIVSEANLLETWKPEIPMGDGSSYGMGWTIQNYHGQRLMQHGGGTAGFTTELAFLPEAGIGVVVMTNRSLSVGFGPGVRDYVFETAFGLEHTSGEFYLATETGFMNALQGIVDSTGYSTEPVDADAVAAFLGEYEQGITVDLSDAGELTATTPFGALVFLPTDDAKVFVGTGMAAGAQVRFSQSSGGTVRLTLSSLFGSIMEATAPLTLTRVS